MVKGGEGDVRHPWEEEKTGRKNSMGEKGRDSFKPEEEGFSGQSAIARKKFSREDAGYEGSEEVRKKKKREVQSHGRDSLEGDIDSNE